MKPLILYYSYGGNTGKIAKMIQKKIGGDLAEIETTQAYPQNYNDVVEQAKQEVSLGYEPPLIPLSVDIDDYDTVIIGTPVWWYTFAPPLKTVLSRQNWEDKAVYPFATHGGGAGSTLEDIQNACIGADAKAGIEIYFSSNNLREAETEINRWIDTIGQ